MPVLPTGQHTAAIHIKHTPCSEGMHIPQDNNK